MTRRGGGGFTLPELMASLLLVVLLGSLGARLLQWQSTSFRRTVALWEWEEASRTAFTVLERELRSGLPGRDWVAHPGDSLTLRAFRGLALPCGPPHAAPDGGWSIRVVTRGMRDEDPGKDSLLVLRSRGEWAPLALHGARSGGSAQEGGCPHLPGGRVRIWEVGEGPVGGAPVAEEPAWAVLRYFEWGRYHLSNGALRYRRGGGGRQPLTAQHFGPGSRMVPLGLGVRVELEGEVALGPGRSRNMRRSRTFWSGPGDG